MLNTLCREIIFAPSLILFRVPLRPLVLFHTFVSRTSPSFKARIANFKSKENTESCFILFHYKFFKIRDESFCIV